MGTYRKKEYVGKTCLHSLVDSRISLDLSEPIRQFLGIYVSTLLQARCAPCFHQIALWLDAHAEKFYAGAALRVSGRDGLGSAVSLAAPCACRDSKGDFSDLSARKGLALS